MAKYFRYFPKTFYTSDTESDGLDSVTNIIARFSDSLRDNSNIFYPYDVQDTDTPEIIAHKMYGSVERHWIVLSLNQIIDLQWDWPLKHDNFIKYVNNKYSANANTSSGETGVRGLKMNQIFKIILQSSNKNNN